MKLNWTNLFKCVVAIIVVAAISTLIALPDSVDSIARVVIGFAAMNIAMRKWPIFSHQSYRR